MRDPATANCRIYVGNLDETVQQDNLKEHFKKHGNIVGVAIQRGFGFIQFEEETSAQESIKNEHGVMFQGRKLNVKPAFDNKSKANDENAGNSSKAGPDAPPRKMARRGGHAGRGGRSGPAGIDRDISPHGDDRDYR